MAPLGRPARLNRSEQHCFGYDLGGSGIDRELEESLSKQMLCESGDCFGRDLGGSSIDWGVNSL